MGLHPAEEVRLGHALPAAPAGARGVVEDDAGGNAADVLEDVAEALAHALAGLAREELAEAHVGEGEAEHQEVHPHALSPGQHVDVAEVGLRLPRRPDKLHIAVGRRGYLGLAPPHVVLDGSVAAVVGGLVQQALVYALCAVSLLAPYALVAEQDLVDEGLVRVKDRRARLQARGLRREIVHRDVLADRRLGYPRPALYLRIGEAPSRHLSYTFDHWHADHPSCLLCNCQLVAAIATVGLAGRHAFAFSEILRFRR